VGVLEVEIHLLECSLKELVLDSDTLEGLTPLVSGKRQKKRMALVKLQTVKTR
jgi:hypothetical protein